MVLVPTNMPRLSFGPCKKKICFWSLQKFLFFKIVPPGTIFRNKIFCRDLFKKNKIFWRDQKLQNGSSHHVPRMQIITKMGSGTILKNNILQGLKTNIFFYRDQNLNEAYLQGRVQYLSLEIIS